MPASSQTFIVLFKNRMLLYKQPPMDRRLPPPQTAPSSLNVTTVEERSAWSQKFSSGRWELHRSSLMYFQHFIWVILSFFYM